MWVFISTGLEKGDYGGAELLCLSDWKKKPHIHISQIWPVQQELKVFNFVGNMFACS